MANAKKICGIEVRSSKVRSLRIGSGYPLFVLGAVAIVAACGSADEHPLGGPYGGSGAATVPAPAAGNSSTYNSGIDGGDPGSSTDGTTTAGDTTSGGESTTGGGGGSTGGGSTNSGGGSTTAGGGTTTGGGGSTTAGGGTTGGGTTVPTWTQIYNLYLKDGRSGQCGPRCHSQFSSPSAAWTWLQRKGQISGTTSKINSASSSILSWYGGNMPPNGPTSLPQAKTDIKAWVTAGALNN